MIELHNNLACLQHGTDPKYIQLHAQTQKELFYNLKHKYSISKGFNTNSHTNPGHSMGQGIGNACNQWVIRSDSMANAYSTKAHGWVLPSPTLHDNTKQTMKAFIDDVNLFTGQPHNMAETKFLQQAQADINQWHGILQATCGKLN